MTQNAHFTMIKWASLDLFRKSPPNQTGFVYGWCSCGFDTKSFWCSNWPLTIYLDAHLLYLSLLARPNRPRVGTFLFISELRTYCQHLNKHNHNTTFGQEYAFNEFFRKIWIKSEKSRKQVPLRAEHERAVSSAGWWNENIAVQLVSFKSNREKIRKKLEKIRKRTW